MRYKINTLKAMKFWLWLSTGLDAMLLCVLAALRTGDWNIIVWGAVAMTVQILHGVKVAFFNKTLVNMSIGFCKFQFAMLITYAVIAGVELRGFSGMLMIAVSIIQLLCALVIPKRREIKEILEEVLPI